MNRPRIARLLLLVALMESGPHLALPLLAQEALCSAPASAPNGPWETTDGNTQVLFQGDEIVFRKKGALSVAKLLSHKPCTLLVRYQGLKASWTVEQGMAGVLKLKSAEPLTLRSLSTVPAELDINGSMLPKAGPVTLAEVAAVTAELLARVGKDQEVLKNPALREKRAEVVADNHRYLLDLVRRVGWIDIQRFGKNAASAAILLAKHSGDLLLMKAALPVVEKDVKEHGGSGEMFSVLYDELQIELGNKQRYGTQIDTDKEGRPYILPLEDLTKVDQYRREISILSFEEYRKLASDNMGGIVLRVAGSDE